MRQKVISQCQCSILDAREERLLDDSGCVELRLICNRCGSVLDSETVPLAPAAEEGRGAEGEQEA